MPALDPSATDRPTDEEQWRRLYEQNPVPEAYDEATDSARERVRLMLRKARVPSGRSAVRDYINAAAGANWLCLDCGSENHTRGHQLCNHGELLGDTNGR